LPEEKETAWEVHSSPPEKERELFFAVGVRYPYCFCTDITPSCSGLSLTGVCGALALTIIGKKDGTGFCSAISEAGSILLVDFISTSELLCPNDGD